MKHRYYKSQDYEQLVKWWMDWGWTPLPQITLPKTGIIVERDGIDLAASFIYATDSCICWAEHFISNKEAPRSLREGSVDFLIDKTIEEARNRGFKVVMSSVKHEGLIKKLLNAGYDANLETGMTNLTRIL